MNEARKQEVTRLAKELHRATEIHKALSMQGLATDPKEREKQAVEYALSTTAMFDAQAELSKALSQPPSVEPEQNQ